jgi:hypothetical protein
MWFTGFCLLIHGLGTHLVRFGSERGSKIINEVVSDTRIFLLLFQHKGDEASAHGVSSLSFPFMRSTRLFPGFVDCKEKDIDFVTDEEARRTWFCD